MTLKPGGKDFDKAGSQSLSFEPIIKSPGQVLIAFQPGHLQRLAVRCERVVLVHLAGARRHQSALISCLQLSPSTVELTAFAA